MNNKTFFVKIQYCIRQVGDLNFGIDAIILVNKINTTKKAKIYVMLLRQNYGKVVSTTIIKYNIRRLKF